MQVSSSASAHVPRFGSSVGYSSIGKCDCDAVGQSLDTEFKADHSKGQEKLPRKIIVAADWTVGLLAAP
jgi:hypothetical protein